MIWYKRKEGPRPKDDTAEARMLRAEAQQEYKEIKAQEPFVKNLVNYLWMRRAANHFGDDIQITFVRK